MITARDVCRALRTDAHPTSGMVRNGFGYRCPPAGVWLAESRLWVRGDGYVTGWPGGNFMARRFRGLGGWLIRRAFRARVAAANGAAPPVRAKKRPF